MDNIQSSRITAAPENGLVATLPGSERVPQGEPPSVAETRLTSPREWGDGDVARSGGGVRAISLILRLLAGISIATEGSRALALEAQDLLVYQAGPVIIKPQLSFTETYNDNIFYLPSQFEVGDFLTEIAPGLKLQLGEPEKRVYVTVSYTLDQLLYADYSELSTTQHFLDIRSKFQAQRLMLSGQDRIQFLSSPLGGVERVLSLRNIDRSTFNDTYTLSYAISEKTEAYARGMYYSSDYEQGIRLYDASTLTGTAGFAYRALPKTYFFGELYYGQTMTEPNSPTLGPNPDVSFMGGFLGARGNFTEKLTGLVKAGYEVREFDDGTSAPSEPVVDISLIERFTDKTSLTLAYSRQNNVSSQYTRQTYTADTILVRLNQLLGPNRKWEVSLGGNYTHYAYDLNGTPAGTYDNVTGSFNLAYRVQLWLTANLGYNYERLIGGFAGSANYSVNRVSLQVAVGF